jgi:hypothetical protein
MEATRAMLPARTALVSFVRYTDRATGDPWATRQGTVGAYAAFVVRAGEDPVSFVPLGSASRMDEAVARWRRTVTTSPPLHRPGEDGAADYRKAGTELRQQLWDPIAGLLHAFHRCSSCWTVR